MTNDQRIIAPLASHTGEAEPVEDSDWTVATHMMLVDEYANRHGHGAAWTESLTSYQEYISEGRNAVEANARKLATSPAATPAAPGEKVTYYAESVPGSQHDTGRVYVKTPRKSHDNFFASASSLEDARSIADAMNAALSHPAPVAAPASVPQAIDQLVSALAESKGWLRDYARALIEDAIDRRHLEVAAPAPLIAQSLQRMQEMWDTLARCEQKKSVSVTAHDMRSYSAALSVIEKALAAPAPASEAVAGVAEFKGEFAQLRHQIAHWLRQWERSGVSRAASIHKALAQMHAIHFATPSTGDSADAPVQQAGEAEDDAETWPEWAESILRFIRSQSGYDGYDDMAEGIDLPAEVKEHVSELNNFIDRLTNDLAAAKASAPEDAANTERLAFLQQHRVALIPEYEGPWDAEVYGESEAPIARGSGNTPHAAIDDARAALKGEQPVEPSGTERGEAK
jgi:hypothetical protein